MIMTSVGVSIRLGLKLSTGIKSEHWLDGAGLLVELGNILVISFLARVRFEMRWYAGEQRWDISPGHPFEKSSGRAHTNAKD